jgi:single-stranded DNA-binding protein
MSEATVARKLLNEVHISGRVATNPTQQGRGPTKFRVAHGGGGKRKDGTPWPTQWFSVSCWDTKAVEGLTKGAGVELFGKLRDSTYTATDGTVKYGVEIVADSILIEGAEKQPAPLTPDMTKTKGGTAVAKAILSPASPVEKNIHGVEVTDADIPW